MEQLSLGEESRRRNAPLAERMRPRNLDEVIGQEELTAKDSPLRKTLQAGGLVSILIWGPPGTGKTSIARALAGEVDAHFEQLSAVLSGVGELREVIKRAEGRRGIGEATLLFVDEIHRWSRSQQDALLKHVESGDIMLVGATTENPGFEVNDAILSRVKLYVLKPLNEEQMREIVKRAFTDFERGLGLPPGDSRKPYSLSKEAEEMLFLHAGGDARALLNGLEAAAAIHTDRGEIDPETMQRALGRRAISYDKSKDNHYDTASALIKSIRGGDKNAALYYMARMEVGGEDPKFVARRLIISASEEMGVSAPEALSVAVAGFQAVERVGAPEAWVNLSAVACYLCECPKSWASYSGWRAAQQFVAEHPLYPIPNSLRNAATQVQRDLGHHEGYVHASKADSENMQFLPDEIKDIEFFEDDREHEED